MHYEKKKNVASDYKGKRSRETGEKIGSNKVYGWGGRVVAFGQ